jgi:hypothetical protein
MILAVYSRALVLYVSAVTVGGTRLCLLCTSRLYTINLKHVRSCFNDDTAEIGCCGGIECSLTARCVVNVVVARSIHKEASETDCECDDAERKYPTESDLLSFTKLDAVDDEKRKDEHCHVSPHSEVTCILNLRNRSDDQFKAQLMSRAL